MRRQFAPRERVLAASAALAAGVFLLSEFVIHPLAERWQGANATIAERRAEYTIALKTIRLAEARGVTANTAMETETSSAPVVDLLQYIEAAATPHVVIRRFRPVQTRSGPASGAAMAAGGKTVTLQVQLDCVSNLPDLVAFFERLETEDDLTRVLHFYLTPEEHGGDALHCQLTVVRLVAI